MKFRKPISSFYKNKNKNNKNLDEKTFFLQVSFKNRLKAFKFQNLHEILNFLQRCRFVFPNLLIRIRFYHTMRDKLESTCYVHLKFRISSELSSVSNNFLSELYGRLTDLNVHGIFYWFFSGTYLKSREYTN